MHDAALHCLALWFNPFMHDFLYFVPCILVFFSFFLSQVFFLVICCCTTTVCTKVLSSLRIPRTFLTWACIISSSARITYVSSRNEVKFLPWANRHVFGIFSRLKVTLFAVNHVVTTARSWFILSFRILSCSLTFKPFILKQFSCHLKWPVFVLDG